MTAVSRFARRLAAGGATAVGIALLAGPGSALASEGYVRDGHAEFDAYAYETNVVVVSQTNGRIIFQDQVKVDADDGCTQGASIHLVECNGVSGRPEIYLDNKDDTLRPSTVNPPAVGFYAEGNTGDDELNGTALSDHFYGGWGSDTLRGGAGGDILEGDAGADTINADDNAGGDTVDCGAGSDTAIINSGDSVTNCETLIFG